MIRQEALGNLIGPQPMIIIGIGANLSNPDFGSPRANCGAALEKLVKLGCGVGSRSPWYKSEPVPASDQPWYVNGVVELKTSLDPIDLMHCLLEIELDFGRRRSGHNSPRTLDLDILAYHNLIIESLANDRSQLQIPHPRMHLRSFVISPLCDIFPKWVHPKLELSAEQLQDRLRQSVWHARLMRTLERWRCIWLRSESGTMRAVQFC